VRAAAKELSSYDRRQNGEQEIRDNMTIRKNKIFAVAGIAFAATFQAQAQLSAYNQDDLLLNFRDASATTTSDVLIDLGNVNSFVNAIASLPGGTAVLDTGTGITTTSGYTPTFDAQGLFGVVGTPASGNSVGFSAAGSDQTSQSIWLTRAISSPSLTPGTPSGQLNAVDQGKTVNDIAGIGAGGLTGTPLTGGEAGSTAVVASGGSHSYQTEAEASGTLPNLITFQGTQSISAGQGGAIESLQTGSANIYEALWEVPISGVGGDVFEGYFTFQPDGEVDFTTATSVPEPSTYVLLLGTGALAFAFRRRLGHLFA